MCSTVLRVCNAVHIVIADCCDVWCSVFVVSVACRTCPIAAIWLPRVTNFSFIFLLVSPAGFVGSEQD